MTGNRTFTPLTCQDMQLPVVLSVIGLKAPEVTDSDKTAGHLNVAANFPADKGGKSRERADVSLMSPSVCAPGEHILLRSHRYRLIKTNTDFYLEMTN